MASELHRVTQSGSVCVTASLADTWNVCSDFERFPEFITGIHSCAPQPDGSFAWAGKAYGVRRSWTSRDVERHEEQLIVWVTDDPMVPDGRVVLEALADNRVRVSIEMTYEPTAIPERILAASRIPQLRLRWDLRSFRRRVQHVASAAD